MLETATPTHIAVNAFFAPPEDPAGITFKTLNLTVFDKGLPKSDRHRAFCN